MGGIGPEWRREKASQSANEGAGRRPVDECAAKVGKQDGVHQ